MALLDTHEARCDFSLFPGSPVLLSELSKFLWSNVKRHTPFVPNARFLSISVRAPRYYWTLNDPSVLWNLSRPSSRKTAWIFDIRLKRKFNFPFFGEKAGARRRISQTIFNCYVSDTRPLFKIMIHVYPELLHPPTYDERFRAKPVGHSRLSAVDLNDLNRLDK